MELGGVTYVPYIIHIIHISYISYIIFDIISSRSPSGPFKVNYVQSNTWKVRSVVLKFKAVLRRNRLDKQLKSVT